jgi:hypothetical protein
MSDGYPTSKGVITMTVSASSKTVVMQLQKAINEHDLPALIACVSPNYPDAPAQPNWAFGSPHTVRRNWSTLFAQVPDLQASILRWIVHEDSVWTQWHWYGAESTGVIFDLDGTTLFGVTDGLITWGHFSLFRNTKFNGQSSYTDDDLAAARRELGDPGWARVRR